MPAKITLKVSQGAFSGREFVFDDTISCVLGRAGDCSPQLPNDEAHKTVSRHHCLLDINPPDNASEGEKNMGGFFATLQALVGGSMSGISFSLSVNNPLVNVFLSDTRTTTTANSQAAIIAKTVAPPSITVQPQGRSATIGIAVTFGAAATGAALLSFQWYMGASPIAGASSSSCAIPIVSPTNLGTYSVVVSNPVGAVLSKYQLNKINT